MSIFCGHISHQYSVGGTIIILLHIIIEMLTRCKSLTVKIYMSRHVIEILMGLIIKQAIELVIIKY